MFPSIFLAHGEPSLVMEPNRYTGFLRNLGAAMPKPRGIVLLSAHWISSEQQIAGVAHPETLHDFFGFPEELYQTRYPVQGDIVLSLEIERLLCSEGIGCAIDDRRGLDHGAWTVLSQMYPAADVPVVELSINPKLVPEEQYRIGKSLAPLREGNILIMGSGGTVNNAQRLNWDHQKVEDWAMEFDGWIGEQLLVWNLEALFDYRRRAPYALEAAPTEDHLAPLFIAMGAAAKGKKSKLLHQEYQYGSLSLGCWMFG
ncbi:dioxygenase family protein [Paenibacillus cremeus]|uniref:Dioxygenase n=1 Tax=Paenibacillus cremeus TaxID=2163881 RepID=A0A559K4A8_9BACL|nr:class III extradiol ring-cleavage dioxygenase [Paenibacillus cremeus]TVY06979.1 dioxygenase [Paenibacillus cremeus]